MTPKQIADAYQERGYDFIAFTDHDYLLKPDYRDVYSGVSSDMILFQGIEYTVFVKGYVHVNKIEGVDENLHIFNHVSEYDLTPEQIIDRLSVLESLYPIDAIEVTSKGFRVQEFEDMPVKYPKLASDDAHDLVGIGRAWIELDADRDKDSIIKAVKNGDFWNCYL